MDTINLTEKTDWAFIEEVKNESGQNPSLCYQCGNCTAGCPYTQYFDYPVSMVMRLLQAGQKETILTSKAIWLCATCETCTTRCPNQVDIAGVMDYLKEMAVKSGISAPQPYSRIFHQVFLDDIRKRGRVFEGRLIQSYMLKSGEMWRKIKNREITDDIALGWALLRKKRMPLFPKGIKAKSEVREILK